MNDVSRSRILVALNFSSGYPEVLEFADREAARAKCGLLMLHVVGWNDPMRQRQPLVLADPLEDCLRLIRRIPSTAVSIVIAEGEPVVEIVNTAERYGCPMIVMGRGGSDAGAGHVALGVQTRFLGKVHLVTRSGDKVPAAA